MKKLLKCLYIKKKISGNDCFSLLILTKKALNDEDNSYYIFQSLQRLHSYIPFKFEKSLVSC